MNIRYRVELSEAERHLIEHDVATLIGQRVFGIALGYEDLNDHEHLRHDPAMAVLAGSLWRGDPASRKLRHAAPVHADEGDGAVAIRNNYRYYRLRV